MYQKPDIFPDFATDDNFTNGPDVGTPTKIAPTLASLAEGHVNGIPPLGQNENWRQNLQGRWIRFFEQERQRVEEAAFYAAISSWESTSAPGSFDALGAAVFDPAIGASLLYDVSKNIRLVYGDGSSLAIDHSVGIGVGSSGVAACHRRTVDGVKRGLFFMGGASEIKSFGYTTNNGTFTVQTIAAPSGDRVVSAVNNDTHQRCTLLSSTGFTSRLFYVDYGADDSIKAATYPTLEPANTTVTLDKRKSLMVSGGGDIIYCCYGAGDSAPFSLAAYISSDGGANWTAGTPPIGITSASLMRVHSVMWSDTFQGGSFLVLAETPVDGLALYSSPDAVSWSIVSSFVLPSHFQTSGESLYAEVFGSKMVICESVSSQPPGGGVLSIIDLDSGTVRNVRVGLYAIQYMSFDSSRLIIQNANPDVDFLWSAPVIVPAAQFEVV